MRFRPLLPFLGRYASCAATALGTREIDSYTCRWRLELLGCSGVVNHEEYISRSRNSVEQGPVLLDGPLGCGFPFRERDNKVRIRV
jgi:hypothetical protein